MRRSSCTSKVPEKTGQSSFVSTVKSFSNDGYSETYADPLTGEQVKELECELVSEYLSGETDDEGTPLLWLGVG